MITTNKTGLFIVFIGPDGCGKSSVSDGLENLQGMFNPEYGEHYHWKPLPQKDNEDTPIVDPHGKPARNSIISLLYFVYHYIPFIYGWYKHIQPALSNNGLVMVDRYYYDFFVDLRRYRLNIPEWLVKLGYILIKKPDIVFCLDADPEVLQARKKEVTFEECKRQRNEYRDLTEKTHNGYVIDATQPVEKVVSDVKDIIIEKSESINQDFSYFFNSNEKIIALPSRKRPRLFITSRNIRQRWQDSSFYPAFNSKAKLCKLLIRIVASLNISQANTTSDENIFQKYKIEADSSSLLLGTNGPSQKMVIRCLQKGHISSYVKYGHKKLAKEKIKHEHQILLKLKEIKTLASPTPLLYSENQNEVILQISPFNGVMLSPKLPDIKKLHDEASNDLKKLGKYLSRLQIKDETYNIHNHPAIIDLEKHLTYTEISKRDFTDIINKLNNKKWTRVIQHGDFAPWNVLENRSEKHHELCAIDWEEGSINGFPFFDLIHYVTQVAALNLKWTENQTLQYLKELLKNELGEYTIPVIQLALLNSFIHLRNTLDKPHWIQNWRKNMWEIKT